jgi:hypothetical protein
MVKKAVKRNTDPINNLCRKMFGKTVSKLTVKEHEKLERKLDTKNSKKKHKHDWYLSDFNHKSLDGTGPAEETCDCGATRKITIEKYKG